ncbi:MAG: ABC transporter ATP-binding protein [Flavobacterium sp.]|nr:ABC transporter ATP-binding protein [Candidatus Neoflavobacterium equi]
MTENIIEIDHLNFSFNKYKKVLDDLSLHIPKGSIYGFLGQNGAGKSTTMRLITGLINQQNSSNIKLFGAPIESQIPYVFQKIGSIIETPTLYLHLSCLQNMEIIAQIKQADKTQIQDILKLVELDNVQNMKTKQFSLGMKQRLSIGMALLGNPELLILDEPVNGLDPQGIIDVRLLLKKINKEKGTTILISSHLLAEIEKTCTHVGIIHQGKVQFEGKLEDLKNNAQSQTIRIKTDKVEHHIAKLNAIDIAYTAFSDSELELNVISEASIPEVLKKIVLADIPVYSLIKTGGLEDWFMNLTQKDNG